MAEIDPLLKTALDLIAKNGWTEFTLADLAHKKKITLAEVHAKYPSRMTVIESFVKIVDQKTLESLETFEPEETKHDRLFSVMMTRFDVLKPYRQVLLKLWQEGWKDPHLMISSLPMGLNSMSWILQAANVDTTGLLGALRIKAFSLFYLSIVWTWLHDESESLDKTMASLDKGLERISQVPGFYN